MYIQPVDNGPDSDPPADFSADVLVERQALVITLTGDVDIATVERMGIVLNRALDQCEVGRMVVDLSGIRFLSSRGIGTLLDSYERARKVDVELVVRSPARAVRRVLQISGADQVIEVIS